MDTQFRYQASASWAFHRRGVMQPGDGIPYSLEFSVPPEFGGEGHNWTPEHLLLGSVASCFVATFRAMAEKSNLEFQTVEVAVEGLIEKLDSSLRFTKIVLQAKVLIHCEEDRARAGRLLEKAEHGCLIVRSLSAAVELRPQVQVEIMATV